MTTLKPRTTSLVIYQGDDMERIADLKRAADVAARTYEADQKSPARVGDDISDADVQAARDAFDAFVDEASERAVEVKVRALPRKVFRNLMADHPPRVEGDGEEHIDDGPFGVNVETFADALLSYDHDGIRSVVEPTFPTSADRQAFLDDLSDGDYSDLFVRAYYLNRNSGADPKAARFSAGLRTSIET